LTPSLLARNIVFTPNLPWINSTLSWVNFVFPSDNIVVPRLFVLRWQLWATVEVSFMERKIKTAQDAFWGWKQEKRVRGHSPLENLFKWRSSGIPRPSNRVVSCFFNLGGLTNSIKLILPASWKQGCYMSLYNKKIILLL